eukprot:NODE_2289_length_1219_cov_112.790293_g2177_i0.p1 GENE.NODE_2289_length_1219_cov_112.790293_g2177_i0~~NODE_2289_length_1219_cov_112.790293_g2177_i0.p1  ORF type:complete len:393 (+),score=118.10 NODE_2289_length_1219_cov_112.790293_g2177_i0:63-1181(+)
MPRGQRKSNQVIPEPDEVEDSDEDVDLTDEQKQQMQKELARLMDPNFSENFVIALPAAIQKRVRALQGLQKTITNVREQYLEEHKALEKKYEALYAPNFAKRLEVISGEYEPTDEEVAKGSSINFQETENANKTTADCKGIPHFWFTALKNNLLIKDTIEEKDEDCLKHLTNIVSKNFDDPDKGFTLEFHFDENPFFTNTILLKTYHLLDEDEILLDKAEGCAIDWKAGQNLTIVLKKKKQKGKGGKNGRTVTKEEPCESFFNFFKPPQIPDSDEDDVDEDGLDADLEEQVEEDYEIGRIIKECIVPRAIKWYTGEAFTMNADDSDAEDDDDSMDSDSEEEQKPAKGKKHAKKPEPGQAVPASGEQPECKQQ